jgi:alcohol dehydrogenase
MDKTFMLLERPTKIIFGLGVANKIGEELSLRKLKKALFVTDEGIYKSGVLENLEKSLEREEIKYEIFNGVKPNSGNKIVSKGAQIAKKENCDVVIGVGGGSSIDTAKAISVMVTNLGSILDYEGLNKIKEPPLPIVAVPTTAGTGSETTLWAVITDEDKKRKMSVVSVMLMPIFSVDDPLLTLTMPPYITAATGMDALTHAVESYVNTATQPISECLALEAIRLIGNNLRIAVVKGEIVEARYNMLLASLMAGLAFLHTRLGNAHALAMPLGGGKWQIPHGVVNAILLPHVMKFNLVGNLNKFALLAKYLGVKVDDLSTREAAEKSVEAVKQLLSDINIPKNLSQFGVQKEDLKSIAEEAVKSGNITVNPRRTSVEDLVNICLEAL